MKPQTILLKSLLGLALVMFLTGLWVGPAAAASPAQQQRDYRGLEYRLQVGLLLVDAFQDRLDNARDGANLAETIIADEKALGKDTAALEAALTTWRAAIEDAQSLRDSAAQTLADKAGFDADGKVVEPEQARDTLKTAQQAMQDARQTLRTAAQEFRQAMREYRQSQRPNQTD